MKKFDNRLKKNVTYFPECDITIETSSCPTCGRPFKDIDRKFIKTNGKLICPKCSSRLTIKF